MAQVSRRFVRPPVQEKMRRLLIECVRACQNEEQAADFLNGLLTDTEKIMLAKRISIALMILKQCSYSEIGDTLKVSAQTIWSVHRWLDRGGSLYRALLEELVSRDERKAQEYRDALQDAQHPWILPPRGVNWSEARKEKWKNATSLEEPF